jgi:hypothetical protein
VPPENDGAVATSYELGTSRYHVHFPDWESQTCSLEHARVRELAERREHAAVLCQADRNVRTREGHELRFGADEFEATLRQEPGDGVR